MGPKFKWGAGEDDPAVNEARKRTSDIGTTDKEAEEELDLSDEDEAEDKKSKKESK
jgi:hypothetical protein